MQRGITCQGRLIIPKSADLGRRGHIDDNNYKGVWVFNEIHWPEQAVPRYCPDTAQILPTQPGRGVNSSKCLPSSQLPGLMKCITMYYTASHYTVYTANMSYYPFTWFIYECLINPHAISRASFIASSWTPEMVILGFTTMLRHSL